MIRKAKSPVPPKWAENMISFFIEEYFLEEVLGDMEERYFDDLKTFSRRKAGRLYVLNAFKLLRPALLKRLKYNQTLNTLMTKNDIKIAWRQLKKGRLYSSIKIGGFAVGIAACLLIAMFIKDELSYDQHYHHKDQVLRVINKYTENGEREEWTTFPAPLAKILKSEYPEIESAGRFLSSEGFGAGSNQFRRSEQDQIYYEEGFVFIDQELFDILEIEFISGNKLSALKKPMSMVISKEKADKHFPNEDPIGKTIVLNNDAERTYEITGVVQLKKASHFQFDFFLTLEGIEFWPGEQNFWIVNNYDTYIKVSPSADIGLLERKMQSIVDRYYKTAWRAIGDLDGEASASNSGFGLQPITDIHLYSGKIDDGLKHGDIRLIWLFSTIAGFILIIAAINFINLSTAKSNNRASEVGLRKAMGSSKLDLMKQFLTESVLHGAIAFGLVLVLIVLFLPYFNELSGKQLTIPMTAWWFIISVLFTCIVISLISGFYPAIYLSSFRPIETLKGEINRKRESIGLRSFLVVFQFTVSVSLIISTIVVYKQMNFILQKEVGFDKEQVVIIEGSNTLGNSLNTFKNELQDLAAVQSVSISEYIPVDGYTREGNGFDKVDNKGTVPTVYGQIWKVDEAYLGTLGMNIIKGRNFQSELVSDSSAIIINERMANQLGFDNPIGEHISNYEGIRTIIGVVQDFHFESLKGGVEPLCLVLGESPSNMLVKVQANSTRETLKEIELTWAKVSPNQSIRYSFLDERFKMMYDDVQRTGNIFSTFAILAIFVACMGLFALSAFMIEQRSKEIGIRLVLGASINNIFRLLTTNYLKLVIISILIASPIAWYVMNQWLADFEYRTSISWDIYIVSAFAVVFISLGTISYQAIKAGAVNPVENLRDQ
ncbi:MAG: ABC transporter permease [Bacteroidota bacterium]